MLTGIRKRAFTLAIMAVMIFQLAACGAGEGSGTGDGTPSPSDTGYSFSFTDDEGNEITLSSRPENVAVLFSSFADVWVSAGGEVAITVGESVERGFAGEDALLVDGGAGKSIDNELLISYKPDFVIASADIEAQRETAGILMEAGIPAALFHVESFGEYMDMLRICTEITGDSEAYKENGTEVEKRVDEILSSVPEGDRPDILFIRAGSQYSSTKAKTAEDNFVCGMLKELGTYNIAENAPVLLDGLSLEEILVSDPDYIFISTMGDEEAAKAYMESVFEEDGWGSLTAIEEGNYSFLPKDLFQFKPNSRWDEAYQYLIDMLYK